MDCSSNSVRIVNQPSLSSPGNDEGRTGGYVELSSSNSPLTELIQRQSLSILHQVPEAKVIRESSYSPDLKDKYVYVSSDDMASPSEGNQQANAAVYHHHYYFVPNSSGLGGVEENTINAKKFVDCIRRVSDQVSSFFAFKRDDRGVENNVQAGSLDEDKMVGSSSVKRSQGNLIERIAFFAIGLFSGIIIGGAAVAGTEGLLLTLVAIAAVIVIVDKSKRIINDCSRIVATVKSVWEFSRDCWIEINRDQEPNAV